MNVVKDLRKGKNIQASLFRLGKRYNGELLFAEWSLKQICKCSISASSSNNLTRKYYF
jgi:hypothetical protein